MMGYFQLIALLLSICICNCISKRLMSPYKVTVVGAAGGIGQSLSLLLKMNPKIAELSLFDVVNTPGVGCDLSHISTPTKVVAFVGANQMQDALNGSDVVVIVAGVPRKPGMTRDDLFNINAKIVKDIAESCSISCPNAIYLVVSNPINSLVPLFAEVLKKKNVYNSKRVLGVTKLDMVRANTFLAEKIGRKVTDLNIKVVGGHAGDTIVPLLSQIPDCMLTDEDIAALTHRIRYAGDEVVNAKEGQGSATLAMAYAGNLLTCRVLDALSGEQDVIECVFCENSITPSKFFTTPVRLGKEGIEEVLHFQPISSLEDSMITSMLPQLIEQVNKGIDRVTGN